MSVPIATCKVQEIHENIRKHNRHVHELENIHHQGGSRHSLGSASESDFSPPSSPQPERKLPDPERTSQTILVDRFRHLKDSLFGGIFLKNRGRTASLPSSTLQQDLENEDSLVKKIESFGPCHSGRSQSLPSTTNEGQCSSNSSDSRKCTSQMDP
ncbi:uncharacterized protein LOC135503211 [Lineus longissimus]|uniref:uncharacterized protein LOC135503211 n=1 Tax=Lineus longissimus TaxID=88925 RepID=UPI002B4DF6D7